jgi:hypothetical protein
VEVNEEEELKETEDAYKRVRWPRLVDFVFSAAAVVVAVFL